MAYLKIKVPKVYKKYVPSLPVAMIGLGVLVAAGLSAMMAHYTFTPLALSYHLNKIPISSKIKVSFSQEVMPQLNYNLEPGIAGTWETQRDLAGVTAIVFTPKHELTPGTTYKLKIGHIQKLGSSRPVIADKSVTITTEPPADIKSVSPGDGSANAAITAPVAITLKNANHGLRHLKLTSDAPVALKELGSKDDTTFHWEFVSPLAQGTTYHLYVDDTSQRDPKKQRLETTSFTTVTEPKLTEATQKDHFYPGDTITVKFDQPMKQLAGAVTFSMPGSGGWQGPSSYVFTPNGLSPGSAYTYTVHKNAASVAGGVVQADHTFTISPPGAVYVTASSPHGGSLGLGTATSFSFDQPVDHASAQAAFGISPGAPGAFSWSGNTMTFKPTTLDYQTTYNATLQPGVRATFGLPSNRSFSNGFNTAYQVLKLNVPQFHQAYSLSCEAASLRMALAYRGVNVTDYDILNAMSYAPRPRDTASNSWDNPYQMYVGDINGVQGSTGWGVYSPPIAAAARRFGRNATAVTGISANTISQAIHDGNPVVLWGFSGSTVKPDSWNTTSGVVNAPRNEHARTIYGVAGSPSNPIGFYINDPFYGQFYWTTGQLISNMTFSGSLASQGVIVY